MLFDTILFIGFTRRDTSIHTQKVSLQTVNLNLRTAWVAQWLERSFHKR